MKKISKIISITFIFIYVLVFHIQNIYADVIVPGQPKIVPSSSQDRLAVDTVGNIVILAIIVSTIGLIIIRKKNVNKSIK